MLGGNLNVCHALFCTTRVIYTVCFFNVCYRMYTLLCTVQKISLKGTGGFSAYLAEKAKCDFVHQ